MRLRRRRMTAGRYRSLALASLASLSAGTNYLYSSWSPQLTERLALSSTSTNLIGVCGNLGVYLTGPFSGIVVDRQGPRLVLAFAGFSLLMGYASLYSIYSSPSAFKHVGILGLSLANAMTGIGSSAALSASVNTVAKSFSAKQVRPT